MREKVMDGNRKYAGATRPLVGMTSKITAALQAHPNSPFSLPLADINPTP